MTDNNKSSLNLNVKTFISTVLILLAIMIFAGILTQILPQGSFERATNADGTVLIIPDTYKIDSTAEKLPVYRWFTAPFEVFTTSDGLTAIVIIIFIILIGGTFTILEKCGVFNYVINLVISKYGAKKYALLKIICLICMLLGSTMGLLEETVPLVPLIVSLSLALGWDTLVGLGMSLLSVGFGFAAGTFNPFTVAIAQRLAGVELFSGLLFRICVFIIVYFILITFLASYAKKIEAKPSLSPVYESDLSKRGANIFEDNIKILENKNIKNASLAFGAALSGVFAYVILGMFVSGLSDYSMPVMAILITIGGIIAGKISKYTEKGLGKDFLKGMLTIAPSALLIIMAMSAKQIISAGGIMDTILYKTTSLLSDVTPYSAVLLLYLFVLVIQFFISGASAKAFLIMPLIVPLGDLLGLTRQTVVEAFCFGDGFTNMFFPTNALLLIALGLAGVKYSTWFKWTVKLQLLLFAVTSLLLLAAVAIGYS